MTSRVRRLLAALFTVAALPFSGCGDAPPPEAPADTAPTVILVSIDGFRWDYLDRYDAPTLRRVADEGVRAERLVPAFPSKTFPNHYTIVTGLYPEHHGIVSNNMYDPAFDASFSLGDREAVRDARWWGGEPIWVTAERAGQRTAPVFWPGSEAPIGGLRPTCWAPYDDDVPAAERVDRVLDLLARPADERPTFLTLYFSDVDHAGHDYGPDAAETAAAVAEVDGQLGRLVEGLEARGLYDGIHLLVVSDHGMADTSRERVVFLDDYVDPAAARVVDLNPVVMLRPEAGREASVYRTLQAAPHLSVYRREDVPERLHFRDHRRIPPVVALADPGWVVTTRAAFARRPGAYVGGTHGYDPEDPSMGGLFVARGPSLRRGVEVEPFSSIHLYNLMAALLGVEPAPNDGDPAVARRLLAPEAVAP